MAKRKVVAKKSGSKKKVDFYRNELNLLLPTYFMIRDCIAGEQAIKGMIGTDNAFSAGSGNGGLPLTTTNIIVARAVRYLPQPNAEDKSEANIQRYKAYVTRAMFYNVTGRTLEGMKGQIFLRDPDVNIPSELSMMTKDATGSGLTLDQTAGTCVQHCIAYGRAGILVDYPVTTGSVTKKMVDEDGIRPTFTIYEPWDIINWRVAMIGAEKVLTLLVLREVIDEEDDDGFELEQYEQFRTLKFDPDGNHVVEIYRNTGAGFTITNTSMPKDAKGQPFTRLPFMFVGAINNDVVPNKPPLQDLATVNVAHYRNSADYEESCFQAGQPTLVLSGLSDDWVQNTLKGSVALGSRAAIPLPIGGKAEIIQAQPNSLPIEAMKQKEIQMVALGAKLVQIQHSSKTATQQIIETTSESSTLAMVSKNVSDAFEWALGVAASFVGAATTAIKYRLNKDFDLTSMTADDQNAVILQWQSGALASSEMRTVLRRAGTATLDDAAWKTEVQADIDAGIIADPVPPEIDPNAPVPSDGGTPPKAKSGAGGPQPKRIRRQPKPGTTA